MHGREAGRVDCFGVQTLPLHIYVGSIEPFSREDFTFLGHTLSHLPATSTRSLRRNHTCNSSTRRHGFRFYIHQAHSHQCFRAPFPCSLLPSWNQKYNRNCKPCAHRHNFRAGSNCGHQRRCNRLFTHTPIHDGEYTHCITNSGTNQSLQRSRFHPKKTRQGNGTPRLQLSHKIQFRFTKTEIITNGHRILEIKMFLALAWRVTGIRAAHWAAAGIATPIRSLTHLAA